jgi:hypothetical protein
MSIISSKHVKKHGHVDWLFVLFALALVLLVLAPFNGNIFNFMRTAPEAPQVTRFDLSTSGSVSFAADQEYWDANCSHGWSANAGCDTIVARTQSCSASVDSVYCSEYDKYLQRYRNR